MNITPKPKRTRPKRALLVPGARYGAWTVLREVAPRGIHRFALCRCDCGIEREMCFSTVRKGSSRSCGCQRYPIKHGGASQLHKPGATRTTRKTPEYSAWGAMRQRCNNPRCECYDRYGGRGIRICERWDSFENFLADLGKRPSEKHSLDRIDNDGDYEPGNVRWALRQTQQNNLRSNVFLEYEGERLSVTEWARRKGLKLTTLQARVKRGWPIEKALETPGRPSC